ncbi:MAG TPA: glycoside hydrolase family 9 protein [Fibrobacteria bacterium]|nr:glycoside hydrolase family 9 protein [Fibrobacteria bacterium]
MLSLPLLVALAHAALAFDDFETPGATSPGGGGWITYQDSLSSEARWTRARSPGATDSKACGRLEVKLSGVSGYGGASGAFQANYGETDLSAQVGVRFRARTNAGSLKVQIPTTTTNTSYNHYEATVPADTVWRLFEVPFSKLKQSWGTASAWTPAKAIQVGFLVGNNTGKDLWAEIDDIEFYQAGEEKIAPDTGIYTSRFPKVDQVGYESSWKKRTVITTPHVWPGDTFHVVDAQGKSHFTGLWGGVWDDSATSGEMVAIGDFDAFTEEGTWRIETKGVRSAPFSIKAGVYADLYKNALRCFSTIRCGAAVHDERVGIDHPVCHRQDTSRSDTGLSGDFHGGWHNAGDFGKWVHEASISVASFLWLVELDRIRSGRELTPSSALLDEARWGLEWILRMQRADGSFFHKVDAEPEFSWGKTPDQDLLPRWASLQARNATEASSVDAGDACAVLSQGARVFENLDAAFSRRMLEASERALAWLSTHRGVGQGDIYYTDKDSRQEEFWARAEWARRKGDSSFQMEVLQEFQKLASEPVSWFTPQLFGAMSLATSKEVYPWLSSYARTTLQSTGSWATAIVSGSAYGTPLRSTEFWWGSNETALFRAQAMVFAGTVSSDGSFDENALRVLHHLLGVNALDTSFVAGFGEKAIRHPYHWSTFAYGTPMPGWITGGPNNQFTTLKDVAYDQPLYDLVKTRHTPAAKSYLDLCSASGSYASNEGQTTEQAALVFLAGWYAGEGAWADPSVSVKSGGAGAKVSPSRPRMALDHGRLRLVLPQAPAQGRSPDAAGRR